MAKKNETALPDLGFQIEPETEKFDWEDEEEGNETEKEKEGETVDPDEDDKKVASEDGDGEQDEIDDNSADSKKAKTTTGDAGNDDDEDSESEPNEEAYESFFDIVSDKLGIDVDDDFEKPKTAEELAGFFEDVIRENSKPEYSSDIVRELDEYMKNGGDFEKFYKIKKDSVSYENIDLENESNQRRVISDYLELSGYDDNQIARKIKRYEDTGVLKDEAEDALQSVKKAKEKEAENLLKQQERERREYEANQRAIFESAVKVINKSDNIRGIKLSNRDKRDLVKYMFQLQPNGKTKWQEDYGKSVANMVESAFFTMKGDAAVSSIEKRGETNAAIKFKKSLASNKIHGTKASAKSGNLSDFVSAFGL